MTGLPRHHPPAAAPLPAKSLIAALRSPQRGEQSRRQFEHMLEVSSGARMVVTTASGRTALRWILETLRACPAQRGRSQVILPAYTCPVLVGVVRDSRLTPVLCDLEPRQMDFDPDQLRRLVNEDVLAVIHVHPFGLPRDRYEVERLARSAGAIVIEDACQALGATTKGGWVGALRSVGFASFGPGKPLSLGGGGMLLVQDEARIPAFQEYLARHVDLGDSLLESGLAWTRLAALDLIFRPTGWWLASRIGLQRMGDDQRNWGYRMRRLSVAQARIGLAAFPGLDDLNAARQRVGRALANGLEGCPGISQVSIPLQADPIYLRFPFLVEDQERREGIYRALWSQGFGVGKMYRKSLDEIFPDLGAGAFPGAALVAHNLLTLPTHQFIGQQDVEKMISLVQESIK